MLIQIASSQFSKPDSAKHWWEWEIEKPTQQQANFWNLILLNLSKANTKV